MKLHPIIGTLTAKHIKAGRVSNAFRDQNIDVHRIKKYFDKDGWLAILKTMEDKEKEAWSCSVCLQALDHDKSDVTAVWSGII